MPEFAVETPIVDLPESEWDRQLDIDLKGVFLCCQAVAKEMIRQKQGKIVNIASQMGHAGLASTKLGAYCAAKAGLHLFTVSLRHQLKETSIKVFEVISPAVNTELGTNSTTEEAQEYRA
jgi:NAD(P)-dependent dehydrogenase (short-subunit alcohol dehydrogenase family)